MRKHKINFRKPETSIGVSWRVVPLYSQNYLIECLSTAGVDLHVLTRKVMNYQNQSKIERFEMLKAGLVQTQMIS